MFFEGESTAKKSRLPDAGLIFVRRYFVKDRERPCRSFTMPWRLEKEILRDTIAVENNI